MFGIMKLSGGIGNQLFQYATALSYSKKFGIKIYFDLIEYKHDLNRSVKLTELGLPFNEAKFYHKILFRQKILNSWLLRLLKFFKIVHPVIINENGNLFEPKIFNKYEFVYFEGYWANCLYFNEYLSEIFSPMGIPNKLCTEKYNSIKFEIEQNNSISIHIRRGDYVQSSHANNLFGVVSINYYLSAIYYFSEQINDPTFYVFSDDINWAKENICTNGKFVFVSEVENCSDYLEFELMRVCKHNIIANSTFSWWAAYLNKNTNKIVIQPQEWYKNPGLQKVYNSKAILDVPNSIRL